MLHPKVTVGLPFHNNATTLLDAVRSIVGQTYTNWEAVLINDGSTDGSVELVTGLSDKRIRMVHDEQNLGLSARLNQIAMLAQGTYLARMDADDLMHPERLERQLQFLNENRDCDVVGTGLYSIDASGHPTGIRGPRTEVPNAHGMLAHSYFAHPTIMGKTSWFRDNLYDGSLLRVQDHELWVRTYSHSSFANIDQPLMFVRERGTVTAGKYARSARAERRILRTYGPRTVGSPQTGYLLFSSYLKQLAYYLLEMTGAVDIAVKRRSAPLSAQECSEANRILKRIKQPL